MKNYRFSYEEEGVDKELINLTPLIDVIFVVLISFIIIAPFLEVEMVQLAEPSLNTAPLSPISSLKIVIKEDNTIWFENRQVNREELYMLLHQEPKEKLICLYQDKHAFFGTYQQVKNTVEKAGFESLQVVLQGSNLENP